ncbi:hypothetical protein NDU88_012276 [Pleurodeles waltl]|uniref:Uncharacterized protein n=1 Tax=Pleurodeles waltl TaxID=8319 RepID=A0AAV7QZN8_PLEWA|nr:hypothetical protein NDU88_012276 [Pleurodeles waltl]
MKRLNSLQGSQATLPAQARTRERGSCNVTRGWRRNERKAAWLPSTHCSSTGGGALRDTIVQGRMDWVRGADTAASKEPPQCWRKMKAHWEFMWLRRHPARWHCLTKVNTQGSGIATYICLAQFGRVITEARDENLCNVASPGNPADALQGARKTASAGRPGYRAGEAGVTRCTAAATLHGPLVGLRLLQQLKCWQSIWPLLYRSVKKLW